MNWTWPAFIASRSLSRASSGEVGARLVWRAPTQLQQQLELSPSVEQHSLPQHVHFPSSQQHLPSLQVQSHDSSHVQLQPFFSSVWFMVSSISRTIDAWKQKKHASLRTHPIWHLQPGSAQHRLVLATAACSPPRKLCNVDTASVFTE